MKATGIVRQDTLPADDPSWLPPQRLQAGHAAPIPPRNEEPIYIQVQVALGAYDRDETPQLAPRPAINEESPDVTVTLEHDVNGRDLDLFRVEGSDMEPSANSPRAGPVAGLHIYVPEVISDNPETSAFMGLYNTSQLCCTRCEKGKQEQEQ